MAKTVWIELDRAGVGNLLKSPEVASFLEDIGNTVAQNAGPEYQSNINSTRRTTRVIVEVIDPRPDAKWREAKTGNLAKALGAAKL